MEKTLYETMKDFVEMEKEYLEAKHQLLIALLENPDNRFLKVDYNAIRREVEQNVK